MLRLLSALTAFVVAPHLGAQTRATATVVPSRPMPGALVRVYITAPAGAKLEGTLAGEPLHFSRESDGRWMSLGGVPIDSADSVALRVTVAGAGADSNDERIARSVL